MSGPTRGRRSILQAAVSTASASSTRRIGAFLGGPSPKRRRAAQIDVKVDAGGAAGGPGGGAARAAVAPKLCVTAFRRFCSEQRNGKCEKRGKFYTARRMPPCHEPRGLGSAAFAVHSDNAT